MIRHSGRPSQSPSPRPERGSGGTSELDDEDCARLALEGDRAASTELVRRYTPGIYHLFVRLFSDQESASDATQEVFLRAHRSLGQFDSKRSFRSWLYAIAWNFARDHFRRQSRRPDGKILSLEGFRDGSSRQRGSAGGAVRGGTFEPADERAKRPDETLESKDHALWVREALDRLAPPHRAILVLREYEGLSYAELAELVGCRVGTVKSRIHRARLELKDTLLSLRPRWVEDRAFGKG